MSIVDETVARLEAGLRPDELEAALVTARELVEKGGAPVAVDLEELGAQLGWSEAVIEQRVSSGDVTRLRQALIAFVEEHPGRPDLGHAIFALSKCSGSPELVAFAVGVLASERADDPAVVHQTLIALENWGEDLGRRGSSVRDVHGNRETAAAYLRRRGR